MALQPLFDRSPVLPVDATISLARYLNSIHQTQKQAISSKKSGDISRATLLHIRVLQLVCKTLPSHPDYTLPENAPVLRELRTVAHVSFRDVERLALQLTTSVTATAATAAATARKTRPQRRSSTHRKLTVSTNLFDLFERIAADRSARGDVTIGLLAARIDSVTSDTVKEDEIVSLIIPPQTYGSEWSGVRYERDVSHLLEIKDLVIVGLISALPRARRCALPLRATKALSVIQSHFPGGVAIVVTPRDTAASRVGCFALSDKAVAFVAGLDSDVRDDVIPSGVDGEGEPVVVPARHIEQREDGTPAFKLYDLRPLAAARDDHTREEGERKS